MYKDIWLFIDRPDRADDNAEHLYRYIKENRISKNIYFILDKSSMDWERLYDEGFNLVSYGGLRHLILYISARLLISSHLPKYDFRFIHKRILKKIIHFKFIFLQHGVNQNSIYHILNRHKIEVLICSSFYEYREFLSNPKYKNLNSNNLILTGLPRFDRLLSLKLNREKQLLIAPTWRSYLDNEDDFFRIWSNFLNSSKFYQILKKYNYRVLFYPHTELKSYLKRFDIPNFIQTPIEKNIQELLVKSNIMITDYSSVAFDMGIQYKPIIYFQFDRDKFFSEHLYKEGYFDYKRDAFGKVCSNIDTLLLEIERLLKRDGELENSYYQKIEKTFAFIDTNNCKRVLEKINEIR
jgi:CDP-glycerol glycerophosphotransferase (TagB/SpsB family)